MRVAIVHDYIKEYGGAERVLEALQEIWPESTIFTSLYLPEYLGPHKDRFKKWKIKTSFFQKIPFKQKLISPLRVASKLIFERFDLTKYDLIIVSATGAYIPNLIKKKTSAIHICYCHTPPRYLYGYPTARNWRNSFVGRIAGGIINHSLRITDFGASCRPDFYIANSQEVKRRIKKFYRREAWVIYPPAFAFSVAKASAGKPVDRKYYLAGGRLARAKHIDLVIETANKMKLKLKIFGRTFAGYENELRHIAGPTVEFVGEIGDDKLGELYSNCKALIYPSEFEDFGIMPVEAQAYGRPVVALRSGGVKESVIEGKTGVFFDQLTVDSLSNAIKKLERLEINGENCIRNARRFSKGRFKREIIKFINSKIPACAEASAGRQETKKNA